MTVIRKIIRKLLEFFWKIVRPFRMLTHELFGKYSCNVCNRKVIDFCTIASRYTKNYIRYGYDIRNFETCNYNHYVCPRCGAADRNRLYAMYIEHYLCEHKGFCDGFKLLYFAPVQSLSSFIRSRLKGLANSIYRTADLFMDDVDDKVDIMNMKDYPDGEYDFFICSHVLEHVRDDRKAMRELNRILSDGGQGILMVPINLTRKEIDEDPDCADEQERWRRFGQGDHVRSYSKCGFVERIHEVGFDVEQLGVEYFGPEQFNKYGIGKKSVLYVVKKNTSVSNRTSVKQQLVNETNRRN